jgi:hypothetical protein
MSHDKIKAAARNRAAQTGEPYAAARRAVMSEHKTAEGKVAAGRGPGYALAMSGEIHDWLADLCGSQTVAAERVTLALAALMREGSGLGAPLVVSAVDSWRWALVAALDVSYTDRLQGTQILRRGYADAATLARDIQDQLAELQAAQARLDGERRHALDADRPQEAEQAAERLAAVRQRAAEMRQLLPGVTEARDRLGEASRRLQLRIDAFRSRKEVLKAGFVAADAAIRVRETIASAGLAESGGDSLHPDGRGPR